MKGEDDMEDKKKPKDYTECDCSKGGNELWRTQKDYTFQWLTHL